MLIAPPQKGSDYGFYNSYILNATGTDLLAALQNTHSHLKAMVAGLTEDQLLFRYDIGKWSIKEVLQHLIDAERNFSYRVMRISRKDQAALPMYDIHQFVANSFADERDITGIMEELEILRSATILMFRTMHPSMLDLTGPARDVTVSVRALGFAMAGHTVHHTGLIRAKYLTAFISQAN